MRVEIDINRNDYWNYNKYATLTTRKLRDSFILGFIGIPVAAFAILILIKLPVLYCISVALIGGILGDLNIYYSFKRRVMKLPDNNEGLLGKHTIEISQSGLKEFTSVNEGFYNWNGIRNVDQDKHNIYIFINNLTAHIIPKRAFANENEAKEFYNKASEYWEAKHHE